MKLPCDVWLPPSTRIRKGCDISVLLTALKAREGIDVKFAAEPAPFVEFGDGWAKVHYRREITAHDRAALLATVAPAPSLLHEDGKPIGESNAV